MDPANPIVIFDSDCVLCSGLVAFALAHERKPELTFVGAWSDLGLELAARHGFSREDINRTFLVIDGERAFSHSDAGIEFVRRMRPPWNWMGVFRYAPRPLRDWIYGFVAARRYRWFGRKLNCVIAPPEQRHRFPTLSL